MKSYKNDFHLSLPEHLINKLEDALTLDKPDFNYVKCNFYGIIDDLLEDGSSKKRLTENPRSMGNIPLASKAFLEPKYGKYHKKYINYLLKHKIIDTDDSYYSGKSRCYFIHQDCKNITSSFVEVIIPAGTHLWKYLYKGKKGQKHKNQKLSPHLQIMSKYFFDNFRVNEEEAINSLIKRGYPQAKIEKRRLLIKRINASGLDSGLYFGRNNTNNRIDSTLTSFPKDIRPFIISDIPLVQIDIKNCYPLLINLILKKVISDGLNIKKKDHYLLKNTNNISSMSVFWSISTDQTLNHIESIDTTTFGITQKGLFRNIEMLNKFYEITTNGIFYKYLHDESGFSDIDKAKSKWNFLANCNNRTPNELKPLFRDEFPFVLKLIYGINRNNRANLSNILGRIEAEIIVDTICKRLVEMNIIPYTIHDCVIVKENHLNEVINVFNDVFKNLLGCPAPVKINYLNR